MNKDLFFEIGQYISISHINILMSVSKEAYCGLNTCFFWKARLKRDFNIENVKDPKKEYIWRLKLRRIFNAEFGSYLTFEYAEGLKKRRLVKVIKELLNQVEKLWWTKDKVPVAKEIYVLLSTTNGNKLLNNHEKLRKNVINKLLEIGKKDQDFIPIYEKIFKEFHNF